MNTIVSAAAWVMIAGRIVRSGGPELAEELESRGYEGFGREAGVEVEPEPESGDGFLAGL